ncbi:MAG: class I SAM-dependent methyltransferase [Candidatus Limnocylindrales bacterium]
MSFERGTDTYARLVGRYTPALAVAFCDAVRVVAGQTALDVGCGSGALLSELANRLGPERVAGVDPSEPFLALARAAVPGADVQLAAAEALPFEDDTFDIVMSQLVVNFMTDPERGVREMRRVARHVVAGCVWDYADGMTMLRTFFDAALELDPDAPDEARTMPHASRGALHGLWEAAGLREVTTGELVVTADYADFDDYWLPFPHGPGPSGAYAASLDEEQRAALGAVLFRRLGSPVGPFTLSARAWFVRGLV